MRNDDEIAELPEGAMPGDRLKGITRAADRKTRQMPLLNESEHRQLLVEWNATDRDYPRDRCLHQLFEHQAERTPNAVAVVFEGRQLTYAELNAMANQLAHYLRGIGVGPETLVGICLERCLEMVVGILGILKAGGAYLPLDPGYPAERLRFMLDDSMASIVVSQTHLQGRLPDGHARIVCLDKDLEESPYRHNVPSSVAVRPEHLGYVIYTSGSTGKPKGAMLPRRAILNYMFWMQERFPLTCDDVILQQTPCCADPSVWEIILPLLTGARMVLARPGGQRDAGYLAELIQQHGVTVAQFVPSLLEMFVSQPRTRSCRSLRRVFCGGERLTRQLCRKFWSCLDAELVNLYGPTETAIFAVFSVCDRRDFAESIPIGRPVANTRVYVLDENRQPLPIGLPGELWIGGVQVGLGYVNQPGLTAERFVPDRFWPATGSRMYRTGDRCQWLPDGNLEFLGRLDDQVKLRGFRIELGEIETVLREHSEVAQSAVVLREDRPGDPRLVGYYVPARQSLSRAELIEHVRKRLPEYMVPSAFVPLERLPLSSNGKLDRRALPAPDQDRPDLDTGYVAPWTAVEGQLAAIWAEVLGLKRVGIHDNFFDLGGHSLMAMRVTARVGMLLECDLPVSKVFEAATIAALAAEIELRRSGGRRAPRRAIRHSNSDPEGPVPLSFPQLRFWLLEQMQPETTAYRIPMVVRLQGPLNVPALQASIQQIVARHAVLRTTFRTGNGDPQQVIGSVPTDGLLGPVEDLRAFATAAREGEARCRATAEVQRPIDLERGPSWFARLFQVADAEHWLTWTIHHAVADDWSLGVLNRELTALYGALAQGQTVSLPDLPLQYADFARWHREWVNGPEAEVERAYWQRQLQGAPSHLELPTDFPRPATLSSRGAVRTAVVEKTLAKALRALSREEEATLFMTLLAAFQVLLFRQTGQDEFVVGVPIAGRTRPELEGLIGSFLNLLPLRADLSGQPSFRGLLKRVRKTALAAYEHQTLPVEACLEALRRDRSAGQPPFDVLFNLLNGSEEPLVLPGLSVEPVRLPQSGVNADLELYAAERGEEIELRLAYRSDLFRPETVDQLLEQISTLLSEIACHPDDPVSRLPLFTAARQEQLRADYQSRLPSVPFREFRSEEFEQSLPARFEEQVRLYPDRLAVQTNHHHWTYEQLNETANRIAHTLVAARGSAPERVAMLLDHDAPMIAATLGILKAGKTYVPLEASHPRARLAGILADADAHLLVTNDALQEFADELVQGDCKILNLDTIGTNTPADNLPLTISLETLAYLLYTSGSTGVPKGVVQSHGNVLHFMRVYTNNLHIRAEDRLTLFSSYGYGAAVMDIFAALLNGATLYPIDVKNTSSQAVLQAMQDEAVTVYHSTPTLYRYLIGALQPDEVLPSVRLIVFGGEQTSCGDVETFRRHFSQDCVLVNGLGSTESTLSLQNFLRRDTPLTGSSVPLGYPVDGMEIMLLDDRGREHDVFGEIAIRSRNVAVGYWRQPELTRERFLPDPAGGDRRVYRTGDMGRRRPDGMLECLGRKDRQVKLRGHRIDLSEIEAALNRHPAVASSAVLARPAVSGDPELVAYSVPVDAAPLSAATLRGHLRSLLPEYMIPARLLILERFPLLPNGKLDWQALPAVETWSESPSLADVATPAAPATPTELAVGKIWAEVLGVDRIDRQDHFFDLGGNSLLAMQAMSRANSALHVETPLSAIFESPTLADLARTFDELRGSQGGTRTERIGRVDRQAFRQQRGTE